MPIKPLDRLLFAQGGCCFFCERSLPKSEASIEHLVALTHDGPDNDENCVACCKQLNTLFGRISLKEKLRIVLNQDGNFVCPAASANFFRVDKPTDLEPTPAPIDSAAARLQVVIMDLHKRGASKPGTVQKLKNTMKSVLKNDESADDLAVLVQALQQRKLISVIEGKVIYALGADAL